MNETIYGLLLMALGVAVIVQTWRIGRLKREVRHYRSYYEMRFARGGEWKGAAVYFGEQTCGYQPLEDPEGEPPSGVGGVVK